MIGDNPTLLEELRKVQAAAEGLRNENDTLRQMLEQLCLKHNEPPPPVLALGGSLSAAAGAGSRKSTEGPTTAASAASSQSTVPQPQGLTVAEGLASTAEGKEVPGEGRRGVAAGESGKGDGGSSGHALSQGLADTSDGSVDVATKSRSAIVEAGGGAGKDAAKEGQSASGGARKRK